MPNPYTGTDNDPFQEAQHRFTGPEWERYFGSLKGKNVRFVNPTPVAGGTGELRPGDLDTQRSNATNAYLNQLTDHNRSNANDWRAQTAGADIAEAQARGVAQQEQDQEQARRAMEGYGTAPAEIMGEPGGPLVARPSGVPLPPAEARAQALAKMPLPIRQAYEKQYAAQDAQARAAQSPALKEFNDARSQGYTGTFQQYQDMDANRKRPINADADAAMIETAATNILDNPRDLTSLKTITSLRGDQRLKLFNKLKEKNPDFNVGNIDRQIKFLDSYEDPKGRAASNRASMNNILMHAADLSSVNQDYRRSDIRLVNTPIAALAKQGGTAWSQFQVPLSVLKDEIGLYFAGGYAPTSDQQKTWNTIANDTATPAQIEQFAKDIVHVGLRRADTHNQQFKTMMGYDDPNLLTPDAVQAGQRLGLGESMKKYGSGGQIGTRPAGAASAAGADANSGAADNAFATPKEGAMQPIPGHPGLLAVYTGGRWVRKQ